MNNSRKKSRRRPLTRRQKELRAARKLVRDAARLMPGLSEEFRQLRVLPLAKSVSLRAHDEIRIELLIKVRRNFHDYVKELVSIPEVPFWDFSMDLNSILMSGGEYGIDTPLVLE